jgi:signal transduction histidine kinase
MVNIPVIASLAGGGALVKPQAHVAETVSLAVGRVVHASHAGFLVTVSGGHPHGAVWGAGYVVAAPFAAGASAWQAGVALAAAAAPAAVLLRRRPLSALALLLADSFAVGWLAAKAAPGGWYVPVLSVLPFLLVILANLVVCFIAATRPVVFSVAVGVVTLGALAGSRVLTMSPALLPGPAFLTDTSSQLAIALITVIAWLIGHSIRQAHVHAEEARAQARDQAITAERLRIARDLHDQVAHAIGVIAIQAGAGSRVIDSAPGQAREALAAIEVTSRQTLAGLRQTVGALRRHGLAPGVAHPAPLGPQPVLTDLGLLAATTRDAGVEVDVQWRGERQPIPAEIDTCAFRIIQEAVTNVVRHAGTSCCSVCIDCRADELSVEITDDGCAGPGGTGAATGTGFGIAGMRERAHLVQGQFTAGPRPEGGFRVAARLPLAAR